MTNPNRSLLDVLPMTQLQTDNLRFKPQVERTVRAAARRYCAAPPRVVARAYDVMAARVAALNAASEASHNARQPRSKAVRRWMRQSPDAGACTPRMNQRQLRRA